MTKFDSKIWRDLKAMSNLLAKRAVKLLAKLATGFGKRAILEQIFGI